MSSNQAVIMWFRRDLRLFDNAALYHALRSGKAVIPLFIFDRNILDDLEDKTDRRVEFIHSALLAMQHTLREMGSTLDVRYGFPEEVFAALIKEYTIVHVYTNTDYEPYSLKRDDRIGELLRKAGIGFSTFKDHVIFEKNEVVKDNGEPYTVFTPYSRKWKATLGSYYLSSYPDRKYYDAFLRQEEKLVPALEKIGFRASGQAFPPRIVTDELIKNYGERRDYPSWEGTSRLGVHLRFGTISIRQLASRAASLDGTFLNELIWRDFYHMILWHFPHVGHGKAFRPEYDRINWRNNEQEFARWCEGKTGYPIVDAGMRELNETGYMHNRVRMITASFLSKHLLIDWRRGEAYFARKLLDYDFAANNGGWQWAAGSGCDAAPYFRIFNPALQTKKFDPKGEYIRKWLRDPDSFDYPEPIVDHEFARKRCLETYRMALQR